MKIDDLNLDSIESNFTAFIINYYGSGQHPCANSSNLDGFYLSYLKEIIDDNPNIVDEINPEGVLLLNTIKEKIKLCLVD
jgi:hypothetical protein